MITGYKKSFLIHDDPWVGDNRHTHDSAAGRVCDQCNEIIKTDPAIKWFFPSDPGGQPYYFHLHCADTISHMIMRDLYELRGVSQEGYTEIDVDSFNRQVQDLREAHAREEAELAPITRRDQVPADVLAKAEAQPTRSSR